MSAACRWLRWKGWREDRAAGRTVDEVMAHDDVPCTCLHTCQPGGPDGRLASPDTCGVERACFEPDALLRSS